MTKDAALHRFFSRFMIFYAATSVPEDAVFPYGTYEYASSAFLEGEVPMTVNLWFYTDSEAVPNAKAQEIADRIGRGGVTIPCDGGMIWLKRGSPFSQSLRDATDPGIKRRYLNITVEFLTEN